ncbi:MAG: hypothetical protein A3K04_01845 [Gallionellales bacterium RBG_16_56_9]|nr:MAG: hypothetical protein A3K04_01845 [Gallionellales bacterium RBG_16_56_9]
MSFGYCNKPVDVLIIHRQNQINIESGSQKSMQLNCRPPDQHILDLLVRQRLQQFIDSQKSTP